MAENLIALDHYAFRGNIPESSFMRNGYAIWTNGLGKHTNKPNPFAVKQGETYANRMFDMRSTHKLASYRAFIERLQAIQIGEAFKEQSLIESLIIRKRKAGQNTERIQAAEAANGRGDYGIAYTFLLQSEEEFKQLQQDYQSKRFSLSHANEFWKAEYATFLKKRLQEWLDLISNGISEEQLELTPEQLVDEWISSLSDGAKGITSLSLANLREEVIDKTKRYFLDKGIIINDLTLDAGAFRDALSRTYGRTKTGKRRKISTQISFMSKELGQAAAAGMGQELMQTLKQSKDGLSFNTGALTKRIKKEVSGEYGQGKIKNDVISYVMTEIELFPQQILDDLNAAAAEEMSEALIRLESQLSNMQQHSTNRIFRVVTNVKGYQSHYDLKIAGKGNFLQRVQNLKEVADGLPKNSVEKLIFMLANTMDGCVAEDRIAEISNYIAAVAVAWMWDDYTGLFSTVSNPGKIEEVRMFASGGIYYSASQILNQTLKNLMTQTDKQFVKVNINPPSFNAHSLYDQLCDEYPIESGAEFATQQNILSQRWMAMRDQVMSTGTIGIEFDQKMLERLNGNLDMFLGLRN